jgi:hypothetical protein
VYIAGYNSFKTEEAPVADKKKKKKSTTTKKPNKKSSTAVPPGAGGQISKRRQEVKEAVKLQQRNAQENEQLVQILESVLKKYPRKKYKTFADHQTFAVAELTTHNTEMHLTPDKFQEMKSLLETKLRAILVAEEEALLHASSEHSQDGDTTIAESTIIYKNEQQDSTQKKFMCEFADLADT